MRRGWVLWLVAAGILLAVVVGVQQWSTRDQTAPIDVDRVVDEFRGADRTEAASVSEDASAPEGGVYTYATDGWEEARLLGTSLHEYPPDTTLTVTPGGCGFTATWAALDRRSERWTICTGPTTASPARFDDVHSFYGQTDERSYECAGEPIALTRRGREATVRCTKGDTVRTDRVRIVGPETVRVDGTDVPAVRVRLATRMSGKTEGTGTTEAWLARASGLPLRVRVRNDNRTETPIGRRVRYTERYELELRSLTPQR